jgi:Mg-chelatase subunit ChlD
MESGAGSAGNRVGWRLRREGVGGRTAAGLAVLLLSVAAVIGVTAWAAQASPGITLRLVGNPPAATPEQVMAALGISAPPAELVFLVDISDSMSAVNHGPYPDVQQLLPAYLQVLARHQPQDQVVVITYGTKAQVIYGPGAPSPDIGLPADAHGGTSDLGQALSKAIDLLSRPPQGVRVGGVVLMSDGGLDAFNDRQYNGYSAPGWAVLRNRATDLSLPLTAYAAPLTTDPVDVFSQQRALSTVFGHVETLPSAASDLLSALSVSGQGVLDEEVDSAAAADSGKGVGVTWSGLPGQPLNLTRQGSVTVDATLTNLAGHVPLYVVDLRVSVSGVPVFVEGSPPDARVLQPGRSVTLPVRLEWQPNTIGWSLTGTRRDMTGRLMLTAAVQSTWTSTLQGAFGDMSFSPGALRGSTVGFLVEAGSAGWLMYLLIALVVLAALIVAGLARMAVDGTLRMTLVDGESGIKRLLPPLPARVFDTERLIGRPGRMAVRGSPLSRRIKVSLALAGKQSGAVWLRRGGRTMIAGVDIRHTPLSGHAQDDPSARRMR